MNQGCAHCKQGNKSDSIATQVDICSARYAYLPIYMPVETNRPDWCPGFEAKEIGYETGNLKLETGEESTQEELPL